jgi:predicted nuclease of predicted toxin-antitoxin system
MSVQLVIDMNLSTEWVAELAKEGWSARHWSTVGDPGANDGLVMTWARENGCVLFTHDLDFGTALALTHERGPSVLQLRGRDVLPEDVGPAVAAALRQHEGALAAGALVVVDAKKSRVRLLPL